MMEQKKLDYKHVAKLLNESMEDGEPRSAYALGTWYLHGKYFECDVQKAVMLLNRAAKRNHPEACYDLALCYEKSAGVSQDLGKAFCLYVKSALFGNYQAVYDVGRCYFFGIGTEVNKEIADIWLERAETLGIEGVIEN